MGFSLNTDEVVALLMRVHEIDPANERLLRARLKHLQRLGVPEGVNTGRGRIASYGAVQLCQLALAFELLDVGLTPSRTKMVVSEWRRIRDAFSFAVRSADERVFLEVYPSALQPLRSAGSALNEYSEGFIPLATDELVRRIKSKSGYVRPPALIDVTSLIGTVQEQLFTLRPEASLRSDIGEWAQEATDGNS